MNQMLVDAKHVRELMKANGIGTLQELSARSGVAPNTLTYIMRGQRWLPGTVERLANVLDCDPRELIRTAEMEPAP